MRSEREFIPSRRVSSRLILTPLSSLSPLQLRLEPVFYNDYDPEKPFLAFFSRRLIKKGEELCFAYHGGIDDEEVPEDEVQVSSTGLLSLRRRSFWSKSSPRD